MKNIVGLVYEGLLFFIAYPFFSLRTSPKYMCITFAFNLNSKTQHKWKQKKKKN